MLRRLTYISGFFGEDPICGAVSCQTEGNVPG